MPGNKTYDCSDKAYQLHLPNGIYDIENIDLGVSRADGTEWAVSCEWRLVEMREAGVS